MQDSDGLSPTPIGVVIGALSARCGVATVEEISRGNTHFNELRRSIAGISHKVLIDTLRSLQRDGFVHGPLRDPASTEYRLTPLGLDLLDLIGQIRGWSEDRWHQIMRSQSEWNRCLDGRGPRDAVARRTRVAPPDVVLASADVVRTGGAGR